MTRTKPTDLVLFLLWIPFLAEGCTDSGTPLDPGVALISGSWVWQRSQGGEDGRVILPPAGSTTIDTFTPPGRFMRVKDGTLVLTARFTVRTIQSCFLVEFSDPKSFNNYPTADLWAKCIAVEGDTLRLADYGADMYTHWYSRVK